LRNYKIVPDAWIFFNYFWYEFSEFSPKNGCSYTLLALLNLSCDSFAMGNKDVSKNIQNYSALKCTLSGVTRCFSQKASIYLEAFKSFLSILGYVKRLQLNSPLFEIEISFLLKPEFQVVVQYLFGYQMRLVENFFPPLPKSITKFSSSIPGKAESVTLEKNTAYSVSSTAISTRAVSHLVVAGDTIRCFNAENSLLWHLGQDSENVKLPLLESCQIAVQTLTENLILLGSHDNQHYLVFVFPEKNYKTFTVLLEQSAMLHKQGSYLYCSSGNVYTIISINDVVYSQLAEKLTLSDLISRGILKKLSRQLTLSQPISVAMASTGWHVVGVMNKVLVYQLYQTSGLQETKEIHLQGSCLANTTIATDEDINVVCFQHSDTNILWCYQRSRGDYAYVPNTENLVSWQILTENEVLLARQDGTLKLHDLRDHSEKTILNSGVVSLFSLQRLSHRDPKQAVIMIRCITKDYIHKISFRLS
jgi:hypothetical protein